MIIDSHAYCFEPADSPRGYAGAGEHLAIVQQSQARHHQPAFRIKDGVEGPSRVLDSASGALGGPAGRQLPHRQGGRPRPLGLRRGNLDQALLPAEPAQSRVHPGKPGRRDGLRRGAAGPAAHQPDAGPRQRLPGAVRAQVPGAIPVDGRPRRAPDPQRTRGGDRGDHRGDSRSRTRRDQVRQLRLRRKPAALGRRAVRAVLGGGVGSRRAGLLHPEHRSWPRPGNRPGRRAEAGVSRRAGHPRAADGEAPVPGVQHHPRLSLARLPRRRRHLPSRGNLGGVRQPPPQPRGLLPGPHRRPLRLPVPRGLAGARGDGGTHRSRAADVRNRHAVPEPLLHLPAVPPLDRAAFRPGRGTGG